MHSLYAAAFGLTLVGMVLSFAAFFFARARDLGRWVTLGAAAAALLGFCVRWIVAGHPAIFGTFENTYALATTLLTASAFAGLLSARFRDSWRWAVPWALAALLYGTRFRSEPVPLTISEQSLWVDVHVTFAWLALVALLAASSASIIRLAGGKPLGMKSDDADRAITECLMAGFCAFTAMLVTGAWYSFLLFGLFWQWSTVETLSLATWLGYALVIHGRLFYRWGGRRLDLAVVLVLPLLIVAYFIWSVLPDAWHFFDVPLVKPY